MSMTTLSEFERGKGNQRKDTIERVAAALGTTVGDLYAMSIGEEKGAIIDQHSAKSDADLLDADVSNYVSNDIPVIAEGDASPEPNLFWDDNGVLFSDVEDRITRPYDVRDPRAYGVRVRGDSMVPIYRQGQELVVSPNTPAADGDEVYVQLLSGERLIKIAYYQANGWVLESANPAYHARFVPHEEIGAIHPILWSRRKARGARVVRPRARLREATERPARRQPIKEQHETIDHPDVLPEAAQEDQRRDDDDDE